MRSYTGDSLQNFITGMGLQGDKMFATQWVTKFLDRGQLNAAYRGDWIARKVVDIPADDATREWRSWQADTKDITAIEDAERFFQIQKKVKLVDRRARLYGGAALVLGVDQGNPDEPLIVEQVKRDSLKFVHVVTRYDLTAGELERDVMNPDYGRPKYYTSNAATGMGMRIHPSRVIPFLGAEHPDPMNGDAQGWGDPVLQILADAIKACSTVSQSVASLLNELQLDIVKVPGLTLGLKNEAYEKRLQSRFGLAATAKSIYKILLLDKEEEWSRINANLGGMHELVKVYLLIASGAADIPATRMVGQSPAGLSATGESDVRNYYDRIATEQRTVMQPALALLDEVLLRSVFGTRPDDIFYNWNPLWQMTPEQQAELAKKKADSFAIDVNSGVIEAPILREARLAQLIEDGNYPGLERIVEENEDESLLLPEAPEPDDPEDPQDPQGGDDPFGDAKPIKRLRLEDPPKRYKPRDMRGTKSAGRFAATKARKLPAGIRKLLTGDASTERPLYVQRKVLNANDIRRHFRAQGFAELVSAKDMHVTIIYSRKAVDWTKAGEGFGGDENGVLTVRPGGVRVIEKYGPEQNAVVMCFASTDLQWRHEDIKQATGASWDWPDYTPHITLTYNGADIDISNVKPYLGKIELGPEIFEEAQSDWAERVIEDGKGGVR